MQILKIEKTDEPLLFPACQYTAKRLKTQHTMKNCRRQEGLFCAFVAAVRGVGGIDSWGSDVEEAYRINAENVISYSFAIC